MVISRWQAVLIGVQVFPLTRALPRPGPVGHFSSLSSLLEALESFQSSATAIDQTSPEAANATVVASDIGPTAIDTILASDNSTESALTIVDADQELKVITFTSLPPSQSPTTTSATQAEPDTTGSIPSRLETDGNPTVAPFPTSLPPTANTTLEPLTVTGPFRNATALAEPVTTQTITVPTATKETVVVESNVLTFTRPTVETFETVTSDIITVTESGLKVTSAAPHRVIASSTSLAVVESTIVASSTSTETLATVVTTEGRATGIPTSVSNRVGDMACSGQDPFLPVGIGAPPNNIPRAGNHPAPRLGIRNITGPISTNKFYGNFFLGSQTQSTFTHPYGLSWSRGSGNAQSWGMAVSHVEPNQRVFGPPRAGIPGSPAQYFINPIGIQSVIISATELTSATVLTSDALEALSANINLQPSPDSTSSIRFPVAQGMGFVSAIYTNLQPSIQSSVFFRSVVDEASPRPGTFKYRLTLEDGRVWLLYAIPDSGVDPNFELVSSTQLRGLPSFSGLIQVAKNPLDNDTVFDETVGVYPTGAALTGCVQDDQKASYGYAWRKGGPHAGDTSLLMYALPHHVESFDAITRARLKALQLSTTTKGMATAVVGDFWTMEESDLPTGMGFAPWRPSSGNVSTLPETAVRAIQQVSEAEVSQDMQAQSDLDSMYFSGKALSKFATIVYTMQELSGQPELAAAGLARLKAAFARFAENRQRFPLFYDTQWKGVVSSASYLTGDPGRDFGNSYYNDHHFHYGYFIHAAAIMGYLDSSWLEENRDYVNMLVRDASNPSSQDQFFPVWRAFDWYHGHSWAKGLFESADGKDQESTSEDGMFAYALKMWGQTSGDASMEARGNLMLAILRRTLQSYFLMEESNAIQPANFIANKVTGILFENKIDHTTYFGANLEYIQGIHMIPLMPFSTLCRREEFVEEEWEAYFAEGKVVPASGVEGGWRGILYGNLAIINPQAAFNFFNQEDFDPGWLDGGASRTWYLAYAAGLGGAD